MMSAVNYYMPASARGLTPLPGLFPLVFPALPLGATGLFFIRQEMRVINKVLYVEEKMCKRSKSRAKLVLLALLALLGLVGLVVEERLRLQTFSVIYNQ